MSLSANALTTITRARALTGCGDSVDDVTLEFLISAASDRITSSLNRPIVYEEDRVELCEGFGYPTLSLRLYPIKSISLVEWMTTPTQGDALDSGAYTVENANAGLVRSVNGVWDNTAYRTGALLEPVNGTQVRRWRFTYSGGYITPAQVDADPTLTRDLPYDLEMLCLNMIKSAIAASSANAVVKTRKLMSGSITFDLSRVEAGFESVLTSSQAVLRRYMSKV